VKRLSADDSADSCVKVGHRQAPPHPQPPYPSDMGAFGFFAYKFCFNKALLDHMITAKK
jgi:hypothetical protein